MSKKTDLNKLSQERKKRLANKDKILHRTASGEVKFTAAYWEIKG
jgi:hypothetical protein